MVNWIADFLVNNDDVWQRHYEPGRRGNPGQSCPWMANYPLFMAIRAMAKFWGVFSYIGFPAYYIDLFNDDAVEWIKNVIEINLIQNAGLSGWMVDFGEDWMFKNKNQFSLDWALHNEYGNKWIQINKEVVDSSKECLNRGGCLLFNRTGNAKSINHSMMMWNGDQFVSFSQEDGLKSAIIAMINLGYSGFLASHSDVGGFTNLDVIKLININRKPEPLMRWIEMSTFSPMFRSHPGSEPQNNVQLYDENMIQFTQYFSEIYYDLAQYKNDQYQDYSNGIPLIRSMIMEYPYIKNLNDYVEIPETQYSFGSDIIVSPVWLHGEVSVKIFLPKGYIWCRYISPNECYTGDDHIHEVNAPLGNPAVFIKKSSDFYNTDIPSIDTSIVREALNTKATNHLLNKNLSIALNEAL